jgi:hypothetical protein
VLGVVSTGLAQTITCETDATRPSLSAGVELRTMSAFIARAVIEPAMNQTIEAGVGPGFSAAGDLPIHGSLGVRVDFGFNRLGVTSTITPSRASDASASTSLGQMSSTRVTSGITRHTRRGNRVCGYAALTGGLYRFAYRGFSKNSGGISGKVGLRTQTWIGVFGEFGIDAIGNDGKPPIESVLLFNAHVAGGIIRRF